VSAYDLLHELKLKDITVETDGPNLVVDGPAGELSDALVERLRAAKKELLDALSGTASSSDWNHYDWQMYFEERAAIREYDGEIGRVEAQSLAYDDTVQHWLCLHPPPTHARQTCVYCDQEEGPTDPLLSLLTSGRRVSVHQRCWEPWSGYRKAQAEEALRKCRFDPNKGLLAP
jgi:hypothetical protein